MRLRALLTTFVPVLAACYHPEYNCRLLCGQAGACPAGYHCVMAEDQQPVCEAVTGPTCPGSVSLDGAAPPDGEAAVPPDGQVDAVEPPVVDAAADAEPSLPAPSQLCFRPDRCLVLSPMVRAGLVLWLDPSTLPAAGLPVDVWLDRSGQVNNAAAADATERPISTLDGVTFSTTGFRVAHSASIDFDGGGFSAFVVARMTRRPSCVISKFNDAMGELLRGVAIHWSLMAGMLAPAVQLNTVIVRSGDATDLGDQTRHLLVVLRQRQELHLRVDGVSVARAVTLPEGFTVSNANDLFLGACNDRPPALFGMGAVVLVRGYLAPDDLDALETFLMSWFSINRPH
jgi:hypothetical protein